MRNRKCLWTFGLLFGAMSLQLAPPASAQLSDNAKVWVTGLNNPRGLKFGPDGNLYVAEGGAGGETTTTSVQCEQVPSPLGPYSGGFTSRISKIDPNGNITPVIEGRPSSQTTNSLVSGVADVAFVGTTLYAITAGSGCSHGLAGTDNGIFRINSNGTWTMVADLSNYQKSHPVAHPNPGDFEPDGTWYSMVSVRGKLYAVEPNHGEIDVVDPSTGQITRLADVSATQGHIVPTALAYHGNFYVGNLGLFPQGPGTSKVLKYTPSGQVQTVATDFNMVLGVAFDNEGYMYVLENTTDNPVPTPFTGKVVRVTDSGVQEIASGLFFPTAMTFGPDGALYVSNVGFGPPPVGLGQIVRVTVPPVD